MTHKHDWTWIGLTPREGEVCRVRGCGRVRDRDKSLPPYQPKEAAR